MDILEEIVAHKRVEIDERKQFVPLRQFMGDIQKMMDEGKPASMSEALTTSATGIIAEFKRKSPSKGWIHRDVRPEEVTPLYQANEPRRSAYSPTRNISAATTNTYSKHGEPE